MAGLARLGAAAALTMLCTGAAVAEMTIEEETFKTPVEMPGVDWPVWREVDFWIRRSDGNPDGIYSGHTGFRWILTSEEDGVYLGNKPEFADVNGDGQPDLAVIQYLPSTGWRLLVVDVSQADMQVLLSANFGAATKQAVLLGVDGLGADDQQFIGVIVEETDKSRLMVYSMKDGQPVTLGPYHGFGAGPVGQAPRMVNCGSYHAFLAASPDGKTVAAIGRRQPEGALRMWTSDIPATEAGFAEAASCD